MTEYEDKQRYVPKSDASIAEQRQHVTDCIKYIVDKLTKVYENRKVKAKIGTVTVKKNYIRNDVFFLEKDEKEFIKIEKNKENAFGSLVWKRARKSFSKLFNLIVEYYEAFPFIKENEDLYSELVTLQYGPCPLKTDPVSNKYIFKYKIDDNKTVTDDSFIEFLIDILSKTFYKAEHKEYNYDKIVYLKSLEELYFLKMFLLCLTFADCYHMTANQDNTADEVKNVAKRENEEAESTSKKIKIEETKTANVTEKPTKQTKKRMTKKILP